jgi:hypothetical protein
MLFSTLSPIFLIFSLSLAQNNTRLGIVQPTISPFNPYIGSNSSSAEVVATIQIQIGDLSGSGVIYLSNVATTSESGGLMSTQLTQTPTTNAGPYQTEICTSSNTTASPPYISPSTLDFNTTAGIPPYVAPSTLNFNTTARTSGIQPPLTPTASSIDSGLFTSSGTQIHHGLPEMSALLSAVASLICLL